MRGSREISLVPSLHRASTDYVQLESSPQFVAVCFQGLARLSRRVRTRFVCGSREISLVPSLHRASVVSKDNRKKNSL